MRTDAGTCLIGQFAAGSGKKAGEFYTPQQISDILSAIVTLDSQEPKTGTKKRLESVLDFACGSGSLLLNVRKRMKNAGGAIGKTYGQEKNITTYNLARMNMLLHGVKDTEFEIFHGDTLLNDWDLLRELNPAKKPAFDTVIGLPANLFYSTGIPVCILVLKKCKKPDDVLFINAAEHFEKGKRQNRLTEANIAKIIDTYQFRKEEDRYSKRVPMERIAEEGHNLNISRYISAATAEEEVDLEATRQKLEEIESVIQAATARHNAFLEELGLLPLPGTKSRLPK
jgi:type I restriction-modification system DNA methylase subunit